MLSNKDIIIIVLGTILILSLSYIVTVAWINPYINNKCQEKIVNRSIEVRVEAAYALLADICADGKIDVKDVNGSVIKQMDLDEVCKLWNI